MARVIHLQTFLMAGLCVLSPFSCLGLYAQFLLMARVTRHQFLIIAGVMRPQALLMTGVACPQSLLMLGSHDLSFFSWLA